MEMDGTLALRPASDGPISYHFNSFAIANNYTTQIRLSIQKSTDIFSNLCCTQVNLCFLIFVVKRG